MVSGRICDVVHSKKSIFRGSKFASDMTTALYPSSNSCMIFHGTALLI